MKKSAADIVAEGILDNHADFLIVASGWNLESIGRSKMADYDTIDVELGDVRVACQIADTEELQVIGLQKHAGLDSGAGMVFPYDPPRKVSFHMANVQFPIDIVFINNSSKISRIVEEIEPGTPGSWGMSHVALVVEVPGGFCRENGIEVGQDAGAVSERTAAYKFFDASKLPPDQLEKLKKQVQTARQIQQSGKLEQLPSDQKQKIMWLLEMGAQPALTGTKMTGKVAQEFYPREPRVDVNPKQLSTNPTEQRFKDRDLPDVTTDSQPMGSHYNQTEGYDPTKDLTDEVAPVRQSK